MTNNLRRPFTPCMRPAILLGLAAAMGSLAGCVERTITITSEPPGALVMLNDREIGRTPVDVEFVYYGTYDVRLLKEGYEPLLTTGDASAPLWDWPGPDLAAELLPVELHSNIRWHYELDPVRDEADPLIERGRELREKLPPAPAEEDEAMAEPAGAAE